MLYLFALTKQHKSFESFNLSLLSIKLAVHKKINVYAKPSLPCKLHRDCKCCSEQKGDKLLKASGHLTNWIPNELRQSSLLSPSLISGPLGARKSFRSAGRFPEERGADRSTMGTGTHVLPLTTGAAAVAIAGLAHGGREHKAHACAGTHGRGHTRPACKCFWGGGQGRQNEKKEHNRGIKEAGARAAVCQPQALNETRRLLPARGCSPHKHQLLLCLAEFRRWEQGKKREKGGKKKKLMTHNCHDRGIGPRQLFYIPGMYSMQISTKGRHSFSIVDPEGNQISLWQPW